MNKKINGELKYTTKNISELFNIKVPKMLKLLKDNLSHETKNGEYDYFIWNLKDITEDIFDIFNINYVFDTYSDFLNYTQEKIDKNEKENSLKIETKTQEKTLKDKLKEEKNSILKEESEILSSHLNNIWFKRTKTKYIIHIEIG